MLSSNKTIATNRKALRDYFVEERLETGIQLQGTEVKSIKEGHVDMQGSFASIEHNQCVLSNLNVTPYEFGNRFNHDPVRPRYLLLHKREIQKLKALVEQKGHTLIPLSIYLKKGLVKIELGICKGKKQVDKRETIKRKTAEREAERVIAHSRR